MLTLQEKKEIASHFVEAMDHEDLYNAQASRYLNLNPCYITRIKNESFWSDISQAAWDRFNQWHQSRGKLSEFVIPDGEPKWEKKNTAKTEPDEHSPEAIFAPQKYPRAKRAKLSGHIQNEDIILLNKRIDKLAEEFAHKQKELLTNNMVLLAENEKLLNTVKDLGNKVHVLEDETITIMLQQIKYLQQKLESFVSTSKNEGKNGIILFQRNIYKS